MMKQVLTNRHRHASWLKNVPHGQSLVRKQNLLLLLKSTALQRIYYHCLHSRLSVSVFALSVSLTGSWKLFCYKKPQSLLDPLIFIKLLLLKYVNCPLTIGGGYLFCNLVLSTSVRDFGSVCVMATSMLLKPNKLWLVSLLSPLPLIISIGI